MSVYYTVKEKCTAQFVEKRSKFICHINHVDSESLAIDFINEIKSKYWDAKHNVYAYSIRNQNYRKYSDDGEPQGTAGLPILNVINGKNITDVVIVITRYFGGILLGKGGLVRAYSTGADLAIQSSGIVTMGLCIDTEIVLPYNIYGKVENILMKNEVSYIPEFRQSVVLTCYIQEDKFASIKKSIDNLSCGTIDIKIKDKVYKPISNV